MFEQKENDYIHTPRTKRAASEDGDRNASSISDPNRLSRRQSAIFRRGSQMTRSVRDAVGTIRQVSKFRNGVKVYETLPCCVVTNKHVCLMAQIKIGVAVSISYTDTDFSVTVTSVSVTVLQKQESLND